MQTPESNGSNNMLDHVGRNLEIVKKKEKK